MGPDPDFVGHPLVAALLTRSNFAPAGTVVTCAVSGGADSTALLILAVAAGCEASAVHVDHGLREGSAVEARVVAASADRLGVAFRSVRVEVGDGPNVEARARAARYDALGREALTGHTADDQAETVLLNLMRGAGVTGLAGIRAETRRPLLALRRAETERLCRDLGFETIDDPTNTDPRFRRNRIRHEVVPLLNEVAERDVAAVIARQAERLAELDDYLEAEAASLDPTDALALRAAPAVLARVALRGWLRQISEERHPPEAAALERVLEVARGEAVGTEVAEGWQVRRTNQTLRLIPPYQDRS